jgi:hypothetical protein
MTERTPKGYIWPVTEELGLRVFNNNNSYFEYGYSRPRNFDYGDFLVFYSDYHLIGIVPVVNPSGPVGEGRPYQAKPTWAREWTQAVGLDFSEKRRFLPPIHVETLVNTLHFLNGKTGRQLHDTCRAAPEVSYEEYLWLFEHSSPSTAGSADYGGFKRSSKFSNESLDLLNDLSETVRNNRAAAERQRQVYFVYKRNQRLIRALKAEYDGACQICGTTNRIETDSGGYYTEGHHLIPLGERGYDSLDNVVILCPLCHKKLHYSRDREILRERIIYSEAHRRLLQDFER